MGATWILGNSVVSYFVNNNFMWEKKGSLSIDSDTKSLELVGEDGDTLFAVDARSVSDVRLVDFSKGLLHGSPMETFEIDGESEECDNYILRVKSSEPEACAKVNEAVGIAQSDKKKMRQIRAQSKSENALIRLLKSRARVSVREVSSILQKYGLPSDSDSAKSQMESLILDDKVDGIIDGDMFVNKVVALSQTVQYNVAASFDFKDGVLQVRCPTCGGSIIVQNRESNGKCQFCGATYAIPTKILDLIS
jgi:ribosomal protein S27E